MRFYSCQFSKNGATGFFAEGTDTVGIVGLTSFACGYESNYFGASVDPGADVGVEFDARYCGRVEVIAGAFEVNKAVTWRPTQLARFANCPGAVVDASYFQGNATNASNRPQYAVAFLNSASARFTSNLATNLNTATDSYMVRFDGQCANSLELGNRELGTTSPVPRILLEPSPTNIPGPLVMGNSRFGLQLPTASTFLNVPSPTGLPPGSLLWINEVADAPGTNLKILHDVAWRDIPFLGDTWVAGPLGTLNAGATLSLDTTLTGITPLALYFKRQGGYTDPEAKVNLKLHLDTSTGHYVVLIHNPTSTDLTLTPLSVVLDYLLWRA